MHDVNTGKKCKQLSRELFSADLADENAPDESNNRTSTPNTESTVNRIVSPIVAPLVTSEVVQTAAGTCEVGVCTNSPPSTALSVSDKLNHLANAVSAINSRLGVIGTKVQDLKTKCNSSRAWEDVLNLSRVSALQEPI